MDNLSSKLAKELKDAGFPFNPNRDWDKSDYFWLPCNKITKDDREKLWIPTLSELIEACGREYILVDDGCLFYAVEKLGSIERNKANGITFRECTLWTGKTPEEAVAKLYIALNKKK